MKHAYLYLLIFLAAISLSGQNYSTAALWNNKYYAVKDPVISARYSYETLRFETAYSVGTEMTYYPINTFMNETNNNGCYDVNDTCWAGAKMIRELNGDEVYFNESNDSIYIHTAAGWGQSWHLFELGAGNYIEATVTAVNFQYLSFTSDSCKIITLQAKNSSGIPITNIFNNKTIVLGKNYGFVRTFRWRDFPTDTTSLNLAGTIMAFGTQNLGASQIFDYSVGDVFEYKYEWNGMANGSAVVFTQKKVMSKYVSGNMDTIVYSFFRKVYSKNYTYTPVFDSTITTTVDTFNEKIVVSNCKILNGYAVQFNIDTNGNFGVGIFGGVMEEQFTDGSLFHGRMQKVAYPNFDVANDSCITDMIGWCIYHRHYFADGLGLTEKKDLTGGTNPSACGHTYMVYYSKGPETWGTPVDWGLLLVTNEPVNEQQLVLYPNPSSDQISIEGLKTGSAFTVFDASGKTVLRLIAKQNNQSFDVSSLAPGIYYFRCENSVGKFSVQR